MAPTENAHAQRPGRDAGRNEEHEEAQRDDEKFPFRGRPSSASGKMLDSLLLARGDVLSYYLVRSMRTMRFGRWSHRTTKNTFTHTVG